MNRIMKMQKATFRVHPVGLTESFAFTKKLSFLHVGDGVLVPWLDCGVLVPALLGWCNHEYTVVRV